MKKLLLKSTLLTAFTTIALAINAQTTIIELDGASNDFVVADWTITNDMMFSNTTNIVVSNGENGTLAISNSTLYTDIQVEVHYSQAGAIAITFESSITDGTTTLDIPSTIYTSTATPKVANYDFANTTGLAINAITLGDFSMSATIVYLKITGTPAGTPSSVDEENLNTKIQMFAKSYGIEVNSEIVGSADIFNISGQKVSSHTIQSGTSVIGKDLKAGIYIVTVSNKEGVIVKKTKLNIN